MRSRITNVARGALLAVAGLHLIVFLFYVSAAVCGAVGVGFVPMRLVSVAATLGSLALIYRLVSRETGSRFAGAMAAGLFVATYGASGFWFDLVRVDMLFLVLVLGGLYLVRFGESGWSACAAGVVLTLAILTKQTAVVVAAPLVVYALATNWRRGVVLALATVGLGVASFVVLDAMHGGWLRYYTLAVPASHRIELPRLLSFWTSGLLKPLFVACGLGLLYVGGELLWGDRKRFRFYGLATAGMLVSAWMPWAKAGGWVNTLLAAHAMLAVLFGLGLHKVVELQASSAYGRQVGREVGLYVVCLLQFGLLARNPLGQVPTRADRAAGEALVARLAAMEGEVFVQSHGYLAGMAGRRGHAHAWAVRDVLRSGTAPGEALGAELEQALREHRFAAILCDANMFRLREKMMEHYVASGPVFEEPDVFYPVTGLAIRPEVLLVPRREGHAAPVTSGRIP